jgi:hypothetical protein
MGNIVPNTHSVVGSTRATIGISCQPGLLNAEVCFGLFVFEHAAEERNDFC